MELDRHPLFEPWTDPESGVKSYLLANPDGQAQVVPYFCNAAFSRDQRFLHGYVRCGPTRPEALDGRGLNKASSAPSRLILADLEKGTCRRSEKEVNYPSAVIDDDRNLIFFAREDSLYSLDWEGRQERRWFTLPESITAQGPRRGFCTHLTLSADRRRLGLDGRYGMTTFVGFFDLEQMAFEVVCQTRYANYNHAQYSPTDPHLLFFAHDWWLHPQADEYVGIDQRMWTVRTDDGLPPRPLPPPRDYSGAHPTHEWWAPRGDALYYILAGQGIARADLNTRQSEFIWRGENTCHAQCDAAERFFVADRHTYQQRPRTLTLIDTLSGHTRTIASALPRPPQAFHRYHHPDPHPQFSPRGDWIAYAGTQRGVCDICLSAMPDHPW